MYTAECMTYFVFSRFKHSAITFSTHNHTLNSREGVPHLHGCCSCCTSWHGRRPMTKLQVARRSTLTHQLSGLTTFRVHESPHRQKGINWSRLDHDVTVLQRILGDLVNTRTTKQCFPIRQLTQHMGRRKAALRAASNHYTTAEDAKETSLWVQHVRCKVCRECPSVSHRGQGLAEGGVRTALGLLVLV